MLSKEENLDAMPRIYSGRQPQHLSQYENNLRQMFTLKESYIAFSFMPSSSNSLLLYRSLISKVYTQVEEIKSLDPQK